MIWIFIPYYPKSLGKAYNEYMKLVPNDDDWVFLLDHDTRFTVDDWYRQLVEIIKRHGDRCKLFVPMYNRIGCKKQQCFTEGTEEWFYNDEKFHRDYGNKLQELYSFDVEDITFFDKENYVSGLGLIQKSLWNKIGNFTEEGILGVDNDYHRRIQKTDEKIFLMKGFYLYHWYRNGNRHDKKNLI